MVDGQFQDEFRSARVRALLTYLALESRRPILRTQLTEVIWGGYQHGSALANLRVGLANLRQALDPLQMIVTTRQSVKLNVHHPDFWCDALALDALAKGEIDAASLARLNELSDASHLELLPGFEHIDSPGFQAWLQERRAYYQPLLAGLKRPTEQRLLVGDLVGNLVAAQGKPPAPAADPAELAEGVNSALPAMRGRFWPTRRWSLTTFATCSTSTLPASRPWNGRS